MLQMLGSFTWEGMLLTECVVGDGDSSMSTLSSVTSSLRSPVLFALLSVGELSEVIILF